MVRIAWPIVLVVGFGVPQWAAGSALNAPDGQSDLSTDRFEIARQAVPDLAHVPGTAPDPAATPGWVLRPDTRDNWETTAWDCASAVSSLGPGSSFKR